VRQIAPWSGATHGHECECEPGTFNKSLLAASADEVILLLKTADTLGGSTSDVCVKCPIATGLTCYGSVHGPQYPSRIRGDGTCADGYERVQVAKKLGSSRFDGYEQIEACAACQPHFYKSTTAGQCQKCPTGTEAKIRGTRRVEDCLCFRGYVRDEQNETGACRVGESCTNFTPVTPPYGGHMGTCPVNGTLGHSQVCYVKCPDQHQPYLAVDEPPYFTFPQLLVRCNDGVLELPRSMARIVCSKEAYDTVLVFFLGSVGVSALLGAYLIMQSHRYERLLIKRFHVSLRREKRSSQLLF
jgi:hypothetical protein